MVAGSSGTGPQLGERAQASPPVLYVESQVLVKEVRRDTHVSLYSPPNVRLPNCTGNLSYTALFPPKLMPESDEGELPGRMAAWSLNRVDVVQELGEGWVLVRV